MIKRKNVSLKSFNTFGVDVNVQCLYEIQNIEDIEKIYSNGIFKEKFLILGGGSNILFTRDFDGNIFKIEIKGKEIVDETDEYVCLKLFSGENFEKIVQWTVQNNWIGMQNLAYIPGNIGATPVQNVGAYGVEIKDILESVEYFDIEDGQIKNISNTNCKFGYRDSIFKHDLKGRAIILSITIKLEKYNNESIPEKYLCYGDITKELETKYTQPYTLQNLFEAICNIRKAKLPDVKQYGSCGSTFQNPMITLEKYEEIKKRYPELPSFPTEDKDLVKIPAAYILERLGWKNKRIGECGTWTHPLIVTNYGNASAEDILNVISKIQEDFFNDIGVKLETEINII